MSDTPEPALDLGSMLEQAMSVQQQLAEAQAEAAAAVVEGRAGGGMVTVEVTGEFDFRSVRIDPSVVDPDDVDLLGDLVLAALRDAAEQIADRRDEAMGAMDLGALGGLLGGGGGLLADGEDDPLGLGVGAADDDDPDTDDAGGG